MSRHEQAPNHRTARAPHFQFNGCRRRRTRARVDKILILKKDRKLLLLSGNKEIRAYKVALGGNPIGPKTYKGDNRTPEGFYRIDGRNPASAYHRSLHVSYPNADDRTRAKKLGKHPGGDIFIHGLPNGQGWIGKAHSLHD